MGGSGLASPAAAYGAMLDGGLKLSFQNHLSSYFPHSIFTATQASKRLPFFC